MKKTKIICSIGPSSSNVETFKKPAPMPQVQEENNEPEEESNAEAEKWAAKMVTAVEGSVEYETYKKNWLAAKEVANQAQDAMLSKTEEWAQAIKEITENELAQLANTLEQSMTGGTSFDELLSQMDHRQSLQEEYLTTTNQIYETNKLMRNAQQEIDKSTNSVAKKRLKNFINETAEMQNQNKLSKYELSIQQAKYDLLLAQIALEEAQKAKSTVRLQRDSEGNFGYVYTADQSAVATAEQNLEDKQNALYNIGLEGANDYAQKYAQTMAEAQDEIEALTQAWMDGEIASEEEYQRRKSEIQEYYYAKLQDYSELYQVAVGVDGDVIKDSWSADFGEMTTSTDTWKKNVVTYFDEAAKAIEPWTQACQEVLEQTGLDDVAEAARVAAEESEALAETLLGEDGESGVVGAIMTEVEAAGNLSEAYISIQQAIDDTIKKYEEFLGVINQEYKEPAPPPLPEPEEPEPETPEEPEPEVPEEPEPNPDPPPPPPEPEVTQVTWERVKEAYDKINRGDWRTGDDRYVDGLNNGFTEEEVALAQQLINYVYPRSHGGQGKSMKEAKQLLGFATGGYTGDWDGPYGKVAILHKKEMVLNEQDTENLLASVDMLDRLMATIDLYAASAQLGGSLLSPSVEKYRQQEDILEQRVHIEATFPGVSDRNEIEEAFNNLINTASQYANRKL